MVNSECAGRSANPRRLTSCGERGISVLSQFGCRGETSPEVKHLIHVCVPAHYSEHLLLFMLYGKLALGQADAVCTAQLAPATAVNPLLFLVEDLTNRAPSCTALLQEVMWTD